MRSHAWVGETKGAVLEVPALARPCLHTAGVFPACARWSPCVVSTLWIRSGRGTHSIWSFWRVASRCIFVPVCQSVRGFASSSERTSAGVCARAVSCTRVVRKHSFTVSDTIARSHVQHAGRRSCTATGMESASGMADWSELVSKETAGCLSHPGRPLPQRKLMQQPPGFADLNWPRLLLCDGAPVAQPLQVVPVPGLSVRCQKREQSTSPICILLVYFSAPGVCPEEGCVACCGRQVPHPGLEAAAEAPWEESSGRLWVLA